MVGAWRADERDDRVRVETVLLVPESKPLLRDLAVAADEYGRYLGKPAELSTRPA
jgi:hypothetical protein